MQESIDNNEIFDDESQALDSFVFTKEELITFLQRYQNAVVNSCTVIDTDYNVDISKNFSTRAWLTNYIKQPIDYSDLEW